MKHEVFWKSPDYKLRPSLKNNIACDYLIVGGGITGISLAYFLSKHENKKTVLIEKNTLASGATGNSAGILTIRGEFDLHTALKYLGRKKALLYWRWIEDGLETIRNIVKKEKLSCEYEPNHTLFGSMLDGDKHDHHIILKEYAAEKLIDKQSKLLKEDSIKKYVNTSIFKYAVLCYHDGISVNPLKHAHGLARVAEKNGIKIHEQTPVLKIKNDIATTPHAKIKFNKIILATDTAYRKKSILKKKSTIVITKPLTREQLRKTGLDNKKFIWDESNEYHYLKVTKDRRLLIGFGDEIIHKHHKRHHHPHPLNKNHLEEIKTFMHKLFPYLDVVPKYAWSASYGTTTKFGLTPNIFPVIEKKGNVIALAGSGSQVVCVASSKYIADKLCGKTSPLDSLFRLKNI